MGIVTSGLSRIFRIPSAPRYAPTSVPQQIGATTGGGSSSSSSGSSFSGTGAPSGSNIGAETPPVDAPGAREQAIENQRFGLSGLVGTSLRGLLNFTDKAPKRKTLLGE